LVLDQLRVDVPPAAIERGEALRVSVGAGGGGALATVTVVVAASVVPPLPVQVIV
jgi:hypothetical protein